jgi:hypothetical protein
MKTGEKIKIVSIILFCVLLDLFLHMLTSPFSTMPLNPELSCVANILGMESTASLWALLAFSVATYVFFHSKDTLPGNGVRKGLRYGSSVALIWILAMLEGVSLFGNPLSKELVVGLSDAIPVFLLGILVSLVKTEKASGNDSPSFHPNQKHKIISLFAVIFWAGRYLAYSMGVITSGIHDKPLATFAWTVLMGAAIGTSFLLLDDGRNGKSVKNRAGEFAFLIFGMNWGVFLVFMPLMFSGYLADVLFRIVLDTTLVMIASCLAIHLKSRHSLYSRSYLSFSLLA